LYIVIVGSVTATSTNTTKTMDTTSSILGRQRPQSRRKRVCWKCSSDNPIAVGLLVYIALFQLSLYNSSTSRCMFPSSMTTTTTTTTNLQQPIYLQQQQQQQQQLEIPPRMQQRISLEKEQLLHSRKTLSSPASGREILMTDNNVVGQQQPSFVWKPFNNKKAAKALKIPLPVFVTSLPKSGTTSIWRFFQCGKQNACHNWITKRNETAATQVGKCIQSNILAKRRPFDDCGDNDIFIDTGASRSISFSAKDSRQHTSSSNIHSFIHACCFFFFAWLLSPRTTCICTLLL
jgi:hypothetical protein